MKYETKVLPPNRDDVAPDGSDVRVLLALRADAFNAGCGMAHFQLAPHHISNAVTHRTVGEIWYFLSGRGQMWRSLGEETSIVDVSPGTCVTIPVGTRFQFRSMSDEPLSAIGVTIPPWPGTGEASRVDGEWSPTV